METLSTRVVEEKCVRSGEKEEEEEEKEKEEEKDDSQTDESDKEKQQKSPWAPTFYYKYDKEVYHFVGQDIVISEALDSFAGMMWPAALSLSHYLDTHREEPNLVDKAVLELGAGTGLLSVVAALLGAWVTATDLPDVLSNLRVNLSRNTRGRCRHTPQVAALTWGYDLQSTYPRSIYQYDYVLASDVVYHHDYLDELLATMKHFCRPGTTLIWANKIRMENDQTFVEKFKKTFNTSLLAEDGDMKIFVATCKGRDEGKREEGGDERTGVEEEEDGGGDDEEGNDEDKSGEDADRDEETTGQLLQEETAAQKDKAPAWIPFSISGGYNKDIYHYVGHDIVIYESIDSYGAVMWPAALALCSYLDNNRERVNLQGREVLELGAGIGLVSIVASLLGASVTATDLPDVLSNLRANVMRNTRGRCRHTPEVSALCWSFDLERSHPTSVYRYDYVLAADVVYHHNYLDELLATMKHFCRPGTKVIWANKMRMENDMTFVENFKKTFYTSLLAEDGDMRIFMATCRE